MALVTMTMTFANHQKEWMAKPVFELTTPCMIARTLTDWAIAARLRNRSSVFENSVLCRAKDAENPFSEKYTQP